MPEPDRSVRRPIRSGDYDPSFDAGFVSRLRQVGYAAGGVIDRAVAMLREELGRAGP
jgi:hypothetical protein